MAAITECARAIKHMGNNNGADEMRQLMELTEAAVQQDPTITSKPLAMVIAPAVQRMQLGSSSINSPG